MTTTTVYKFKVVCAVETGNDAIKYVWGTDEPTTCPDNSAHSIHSHLTVIEEEISTSQVKIAEENKPTGGHYGVQGVVVSCPGGVDTTVTKSISWDHPISVLSIQFVSVAGQEDDLFSITQFPNTIVGALAVDCQIGDSSFTVVPGTLDNVKLGYFFKLFDGVNQEDLGQVTQIDSINNIVYTKNSTTRAFSTSPATYTQIELRGLRDFKIGPPANIVLGANKIGASYIPAGDTCDLIYTNKTADPKELQLIVEYLY